MARRARLQQQLAAENNRLEHLSHPQLRRQLHRHVVSLTSQIKQLDTWLTEVGTLNRCQAADLVGVAPMNRDSGPRWGHRVKAGTR